MTKKVFLPIRVLSIVLFVYVVVKITVFFNLCHLLISIPYYI